jgi:hypothetical protein
MGVTLSVDESDGGGAIRAVEQRRCGEIIHRVHGMLALIRSIRVEHRGNVFRCRPWGGKVERQAPCNDLGAFCLRRQSLRQEKLDYQ